MKAIILLGGNGTRLKPLTNSVNKHLLPIFDKPMVYYSLSTMILAGVDEILAICRPQDISLFQNLLGDGSNLGIKISYKAQVKPGGISEACLLGDYFIKGCKNFWLVLGDNLFYGESLTERLTAVTNKKKPTIFIKQVNDPRHFGVATLEENGTVSAIEEKPEFSRSNWAITGLYYLDDTASSRVSNTQPSSRGELEITDLLQSYLEDSHLEYVKLGRGVTWLDTGQPEHLFNAAKFIETVQNSQMMLVGSPEEAAFRKGKIDETKLLQLSKELGDCSYSKSLARLICK